MNEKLRILIIDDDRSFLEDISVLLGGRYDLELASSGEEGKSAFQRSSFDAVLLDIDLGRGIDGFAILDEIRETDPGLPVIMVTRDGSSASAVAAMKKGAVDYIDKQPDLTDLERRIARAIEEHRLKRINKALTMEIEEIHGNMIGDSEPMRALRRDIAHAAQSASPALIAGETGTGKELVAREIHRIYSSGRPFVALNCAAVPETLFESRLFGHEKGAFTGAERAIEGVFELAADGVLFLDEITEIVPEMQGKLLRAIQEREFERVGGPRKIRFGGKLLASTNRPLRESLERGALRRDLYFRLSTFVIEVPPLRERREDVPLLARHFLDRKSKELKKRRPELDERLMAMLCAYDWPGNVRELENVVEGYVVRGALTLPGFPAADTGVMEGKPAEGGLRSAAGDMFSMEYDAAKAAAIKAFQRAYIPAILAAAAGDVGEAARRMGLSRFGLKKILDELEG